VRATIIVAADAPDEREAAEAWFAKWSSQLQYRSENTGCGCCVDIWDVEGPDEVIAEIPVEISAMSDWTHPDIPLVDPEPDRWTPWKWMRKKKRRSRG
jgi:hypothetical protein